MDNPASHALSDAVKYVRSCANASPEIALILGSGLGALAESVDDPIVIEATDIPHLPSATVSGHKGRFVFGRLGDRSVVVIQGRLHMYEGHDPSQIVFPVRLVSALGASCLFVTNASGGINSQFAPGTLMWIIDHINQTGVHPLNEASSIRGIFEWSTRGSVDYYDLEWTRNAEKLANEMGIATERGTYLWTRGPSYETKAEISAFRKMGADAVGMSTVPEVIQARNENMKVIGLSTITNFAAGLSNDPLNHDEVIATGQAVRGALEKLTVAVVQIAPVAED
ncbi:MAG: purine-nucleoside phosphorylase [Rhodothermia bacterium]|nr:MAG: purine-nucleoside phosphorylase [Rhodothermia bacterium]